MSALSHLRLFAAAALLPAVPSVLKAQTVSWTPFSSPEAHFSVSFCGPPSHDPPQVERNGAMTATMRFFKVVTDNYMCFVIEGEYNIKPDTEKELSLNQTNFINSAKATLGTSRRIEFDNHGEKLPALAFTFEMSPDYVGKSLVILKGTRVYMLVFDYHKNNDYTAAVTRFIDSFRITN